MSSSTRLYLLLDLNESCGATKWKSRDLLGKAGQNPYGISKNAPRNNARDRHIDCSERGVQ